MVFLVLVAVWVGGALAGEEGERRALPFELSDELRLSEEDLATKKEGYFVTGLPQISSDPLTGFGIGVDGLLTYNSDRHDPFFAYTPYRWQLESNVLWTTRNAKNFSIGLDIPYVGDSKWDARIEGGYEDDPTPLYFGISESTLQRLSFGGQSFTHFNDYSNALDASGNHYYNGFHRQASSLNLILERSLLKGTVRVFGGLELNYVRIATYDGTQYDGATNGATLLSQQAQTNGVLGVGSNYYTLFQAGAVYDTRDLPPDPNQGSLVQLTTEYGPPVLGSPFNFHKFFFSAKHFERLFPSVFSKLILATHMGLGTTSGRAPFYEYLGEWSSDNDIHGLGGSKTLRGYKLGRFVGRVMGFANVELRYRFWECELWKQHLGFNLVPFADAGRVWNQVSELSLNNYRADAGVGLRVAWNLSTIISADYAISGEDKQFFLAIGNAF